MAKQLNVNLAFTADTSKAKAQLQDLQNQLSQVINMPTAGLGEKMATEINQAAHAAAELKVHLQNATNAKTGNLDFTKLNQSIKNSGSSLTEYAKKIQSIGPEGQKAFMLLAQSVASAEVPIRRSNALLSELWTTMKNTARWQLTSSMLHGFMGAVQSAVGYTEDLNESLNNIRIVTGNSVEQMADFAKEANKAAKALSTSTTNYTNAALIYYQQGLDEQQVLDRADITVKMANVSRQSAEEVSDQMTAIWNNFYDGSQSLEHYADAMTRLGADTASSSDEIAQGLEKFAAIGDMIGLSFDNAVAALATVTATTRQSADVVGTAFKTIFARIQGLSLGETLEDGTNLNKYSEALNKVGISIFEQNGELKDMDNILDEMGAKWKTMSKDQQVALAQTVAGVRQYNQLVALMDNYDFYEQNLFSAQTADGSLQEQADIYAESWEAASERVDAALEGLYDSLINDEAFIDLLNGIEKIVSATEMMVDSMGGFGGVVSGLGVIFTNVFKKQITQSITDASYSLMSWTEKGRQKIQKEKLDQFSQMLQNAEIGKTERDVLEAQFKSYQKLTESAKDLTDLERETYQILLDQQKARGKLAIQKKEEADQAKIQANDARAEAKWALKDAFGSKKIRIKPGKKGLVDNEGAIQEYENAVKSMFVARSEYLEARNNNSKDVKTFEDKYFNASKAVKNLEEKLKEAKEGLLSYKKALEEEYKKQKQADAALEEATGKTKDNSKATQENTYKHKENAKETKKTGDAKEELAKDTKKSSEALEEESKALEKNKLNSSDIARNFVAGAGAAMSAASAIQAFSSAIDTINSDAEPMEKFTSVLMSVSMGGSMAGNALNSLNKIMVKGDTSLGKMAASSGGLGKALGKLGGGAATTGGQLLALAGYAAIAVVAIGAIAFAIKLSIDKYNEDANAAKRAAEAADSLRESSQKLRQEAEELQSTFENYDSLLDNLKSAKEGTDEWREALEKVNNETLNILEKYPDLLKMENVFNETGRLSEDAIDEYIKIAENNADNARLASLSASASASKKKVISDTTDLSREIDNFVDGYLNTTTTYASTGEVAINTTAQAEKDLINNLIKSFNEQRDSGVITEGADEFNSIINDYTKSLGLSESEQTKLAKKLQSYRGDIVELANATKNATTQMENVAKLSAQQILGQSATEDQTDAWSQAYIDAKEDYTGGQGINRFTGKNSQVLLDLLKDAGITTGLSNNAVYDDNGVLKVRFEDGTEQTLYEIKELAATNYAREQANQEVVYNAPIFDQFKEKGIELNENISADLATSLMNQVEFNDALVQAFQSVGDSAVEQEKLIKDILSSQTAKEKEAAEIQTIKSDAASKYELDPELIDEQAKQLVSLHGAQVLTEKEATKLAVENQRMNQGVEDLIDNWEDWNKELKAGQLDKNKKGTAQYAKTINDLTKTIADLVGASADLELPEDFFEKAENLELIEKAAKGSEQAINELGVAVGKIQVQNLEFPVPDITEDLKFDEEFNKQLEQFEKYREVVLKGIDDLALKVADGNIKVGDSVSSMGTDWVAALNQMAIQTGMSVEQMNSLLSTMGVEADVVVKEEKLKQRKPVTRTETSIIQEDPLITETKSWVERYDTVDETLQVAQINTDGSGSEPTVKFIGNGSVSPTSQNKTSSGNKKDSTKKKEDEIERYHVVNKEMDSINRKMERAAGAKDAAFGKDKLPYIQQEIDALNDLINKHQEYKQEVEDKLIKDRDKLAGFGFVDVNADGILDNWEDVMNEQLRIYNEAAEKYDNKTIGEEAFKEASDKYEEFKKLVSQYEDTYERWEEALAQEEERERERISKNLEKITTEVEFEIDINQRDLNRLDYIIDKLGRNTNTAIEQIDILDQQVGKYENQSQSYIQGIANIKATAATENRSLTADEQNEIQKYEDALLDINKTLLDIVETVEAKLLEEFDEFNSKIDDSINRFSTYNSMLDHYNNIIKLSGRQTKDSMLLMQLSAQQTDIAMEKLNATNDKYLAQQEAQKDASIKLAAARRSGNQADIDQWQKQYDEITKVVEESHAEMLGSWEEVLQAASDQFDTAIELTIQKLKDSISEYGLDSLSDRYEKAKTVNEQYLSQLDKEYELNKLIRQMEKSIDETDNLKAKQALNDLLDQTNEKLEKSVELSQYDLEYMQKQYDLELAKIALEEAQNAKSTVRLQRDSEGNFGYVYTADQDNINDAQQNYEDKLAATRQVSEEYIQEMSDLIIQNEEELMDALASIDKTRFETKEEYEAEVERITKYYLDRDIYLRTELDKAVKNSGQVYSNTILGQLENASTWEQAHNDLAINTNEATETMIEEWEKWKTTTTGAMETVGTSSETLTQDIKNDMEDIGNATTTLANDIDTETQKMINYIGNLMDKVEEWKKSHIAAINEIIRKHEELNGIDTTSNIAYDSTKDYSALMGSVEYGSSEYWTYYQYRDKKINEGSGSAPGGATTARIDAFLKNGYSLSKLGYTSYTQLSETDWKKYAGFDTGGYTGVWGPEGKLAMLHQKELVLNSDDTSNILQSVGFIREVVSMINHNASLSSIGSLFSIPAFNTGTSGIEQDIKIYAEFPSATNHTEIEEAFNNLLNTASQYANRK